MIETHIERTDCVIETHIEGETVIETHTQRRRDCD